MRKPIGERERLSRRDGYSYGGDQSMDHKEIGVMPRTILSSTSGRWPR